VGPTLVDAVYDKLHSYTATWRHFVPRQHGYTGEAPVDLSSLTMDHPQIAFRKQRLARYLTALVYVGSLRERMDRRGFASSTVDIWRVDIQQPSKPIFARSFG